MVLRQKHIDMAFDLFVKAFESEKDEATRKTMVIQFGDAYRGIVKEWKNQIEDRLNTDEIQSIFHSIAYADKDKTINELIHIEPLQAEDIEQISYLGVRELDMLAWIPDEYFPADNFINSGFSFVAKRDDVVVGVILAYKCPDYGGFEHIYIDTFIVSRLAQGQGIGRLLFDKVREEANKKGIHTLKLMTKRNIPAYNIYKHFGFSEAQSDYVIMNWY